MRKKNNDQKIYSCSEDKRLLPYFSLQLLARMRNVFNQDGKNPPKIFLFEAPRRQGGAFRQCNIILYCAPLPRLSR